MWVLSALLAVAAQAAPGSAPPPRFEMAAPENRQVLPAFSYESVEPVLRQIGARFERQISGDRPIVDAVQHVAEARGIPMAHVALAWVLHNPVVTAPIVAPGRR